MATDIQSQESWMSKNLGTVLIAVSFIFILIAIMFSTGYMKKLVVFVNPDIENCKGGSCKGSCAAGSEIQKTDMHCADTSKVCCVPNTRQPSPECDGHKKGDVCGKLMLCDSDNVCVTRCEYCALNPTDTKCSVTTGVTGKSITALDKTFSCGCTDMDCTTFDNSKLGTCVAGFCPSNNLVASDYMCCSSPYNK